MLKINQHQSYLKLFLAMGFILAASNALTAYINSSYLGEFFGPAQVGVIFMISHIFTLLAINYFPSVINHLKIFLASLAVLALMFLGVLGMGLADWPLAALIFFIIYTVCLNLIWISLDIYIEYFSSTQRTGRIRGLYWTIVNVAWFLSPLATGLLLKNFDYPVLFYVSSALLLLVLIGFYFKFHKLDVDHFPKTYFWYALKNIWKNNLLNGIFVIAFVLQIFYCIMVVYTPMYLHEVIGFDWSQIGLMFTAMLSTFVFMTYPAGWLADKFFGEKEMLTVGLFITGIFTIVFGLITGQNFWLWLVVLFMTRVGAALVDIMRDTYFFKRVNVKDMQVINLFRNTTSLAYIIGPLLATVILAVWSYRELYVLTGLLVIASMFFALRLKDTQ